MIWACGDMMCRGFLLGATAGRTTLNGEGLQHQDGHSPIMASTIPNMKSYDPAFGYEVALIVKDGIRRMYTNGENIFYYLTVYNENHPMPALPDHEGIEESILAGGYCYRRSSSKGLQVNLLSSGSILQQALVAAEKLEVMGFAVNIWSITSFIELSREADECERSNRLQQDKPARTSFVENLFKDEQGIFVAATDYMKALPNMIAKWIPGPYVSLGTDGYGVSESRPDLRDYFEVSCDYIVHAALAEMKHQDSISVEMFDDLVSQLSIDIDKPNPTDR